MFSNEQKGIIEEENWSQIEEEEKTKEIDIEDNFNSHNLNNEFGMQELNALMEKKLEIIDEPDEFDNISELSFADMGVETQHLSK